MSRCRWRSHYAAYIFEQICSGYSKLSSANRVYLRRSHFFQHGLKVDLFGRPEVMLAALLDGLK